MTRKIDPRTGFRELESKYNKLFGLFFDFFFFFSIFEFVLHSISLDFTSYDYYSIIEMIFNKLHIEVF